MTVKFPPTVAFPERLKVAPPSCPAVVKSPELGLYVNPVSVSRPCVPVAPSTNVGYTVSSAELFATAVILVASVAVATAIFPVPSKDVPPIVLAVAKAVAVPANPTAILAVPSKDVPPIVLAVARAVVVADRATAILADPSKDVPPIVLAVVSVAADPVVF